jgi:NAD(P)-dependent dehydrogenase (short-subunit alcohol dehydrogenase family)
LQGGSLVAKNRGMARLCVVTGSASGIGRATRARLESQGDRVIGVDLRDAEVIADLAQPEGRRALVDAVARLSRGAIDALIAAAGVGAPGPLAVRVNYFGAVATLEGLRPLLARGREPRAVAVSSQATIAPLDVALVEACLAGDEERAADAAAQADPALPYASSKRALSRWIRRNAATPAWAGAGIPLNAVAPGVIRTPMTAALFETRDGRALLDKFVPMPLHGPGQPEDVAELLAWLASPANRLMTGQVIFIDGGADAVLRGDQIW